jgi:hypothetical protein
MVSEGSHSREKLALSLPKGGNPRGSVKSFMKELIQSGELSGQLGTSSAVSGSELSACIRSQIKESGVSPPSPQDLSLWCQDWSQRGGETHDERSSRQISYLER